MYDVVVVVSFLFSQSILVCFGFVYEWIRRLYSAGTSTLLLLILDSRWYALRVHTRQKRESRMRVTMRNIWNEFGSTIPSFILTSYMNYNSLKSVIETLHVKTRRRQSEQKKQRRRRTRSTKKMWIPNEFCHWNYQQKEGNERKGNYLVLSSMSIISFHLIRTQNIVNRLYRLEVYNVPSSILHLSGNTHNPLPVDTST